MILQFAFHVIINITILWSIKSQATVTSAYNIAKAGCNSSCGSAFIPFPFGMNDRKCYAHKWFEIECRTTNSSIAQGVLIQKPYLKSLNLEVNSIDVDTSTVEIMNPISYSSMCKQRKSNYDGKKTTTAAEVINLRGSPFVYSQELNTFLAVGCNNLAFLQSNGTTVGGCVSICDNNEKIVNNFNYLEDGCHGRYCCETSLPMHLSEYNTTLDKLFEGRNGSRNEYDDDECGYAIIISSSWLSNQRSPVVYEMGISEFNELKNMDHALAWLEWEILNEMLNSSTMRLLLNSDCYYSNLTSSTNIITGGWRCRCYRGFSGNPYMVGGCTADTTWYYFPKSNPVRKWATVGLSSSLGSITLLVGLWGIYKVVRKRMIKKRKQKFFKRNGGLLLQKRMSSGEVNADKTILFNLKDLKKATQNFDMNRVLGKGGQGTVYKGMLVDGRIVAVKMFRVEGKVEEFINEFVILSQINNRNVVKLLGCCLETEIPLLVYEFIPNGTLFEYLHDQNEDLPMTWDMRLRIASEIAGALYYLHSIACQPIYHRDIKSTNILLDEKYKAKLADFGASRIISIEATHLTTMVQGTFGYLDPQYFHSSQFTEKSDVYSFGVVLAELLTSHKPISSIGSGEYRSLASYFVQCLEENSLFDIIDKRVAREGETGHIIEVANLAHRCLELDGRKRPNMKEVTLELERIWELNRKSNVQPNPREIDHAEIEEYQPWVRYSTSNSLSIPCGETFSSDSEDMHILKTK